VRLRDGTVYIVPGKMARLFQQPRSQAENDSLVTNALMQKWLVIKTRRALVAVLLAVNVLLDIRRSPCHRQAHLVGLVFLLLGSRQGVIKIRFSFYSISLILRLRGIDWQFQKPQDHRLEETWSRSKRL